MNTLISYAGYYTNYKLININNLYNFMFMTVTPMTKDEQKKYIENCRLIMGNSFISDWRYYLFVKMPDNELLKLF